MYFKSFILFLALASLAQAGVISGNGTKTVRSWNSGDLTLTATPTLINRATGTSGTTTTSGRVFYNSASAVTDCSINVVPAGTLSGSVNLSNPSVFSIASGTGSGTINSAGYVTYGSAGTVSVTCSLTYPPYRLTVPTTLSSIASTSVFTAWSTTTPSANMLPSHWNTQVDNLISSAGTANQGTRSGSQNFNLLNTGGNMSLFSAANDSTGVYTRNSSIWTGAADWSGVSVSRTNAQSYESCLTLVAPSIAVTAAHTNLAAGTSFRWVDNNNVTYIGTTTGALYSGQVSGTDISLVGISWTGGTPSTLAVYPVLPSTFQNYCPDHALNHFPIVHLNQARQVFVMDSLQNSDTTTAFDTTTYGQPAVAYAVCSETNRSPYSIGIIGGDSGWPMFVLINGNPVLLATHYSAVWSPSLVNNSAAINTIMNTISSGAALTTPNLSSPIAFPTF